MSCGISRHIVASSHHDQTKRSDSSHDRKSFSTSPDVEDTGRGDLKDTTENACNNGDGRDERVSIEGTRHVWCQGTLDLLLERVDKVDDENAVVVLAVDAALRNGYAQDIGQDQ